MINAKVVRSVLPRTFVETASREIMDQILATDVNDAETGGPWSPGRLHEMCSQFLVNRDDRNSQGSAEEDDGLRQFYEDLLKIDEALLQASGLDSEGKTLLQKQLLKRGSGFWPWSRYPVCPRLLKQLEHRGLTVGLVPLNESKL